MSATRFVLTKQEQARAERLLGTMKAAAPPGAAITITTVVHAALGRGFAALAPMTGSDVRPLIRIVPGDLIHAINKVTDVLRTREDHQMFRTERGLVRVLRSGKSRVRSSERMILAVFGQVGRAPSRSKLSTNAWNTSGPGTFGKRWIAAVLAQGRPSSVQISA